MGDPPVFRQPPVWEISRYQGAAQSYGAHQGGHATARFLEGFLEGYLKEVPS